MRRFGGAGLRGTQPGGQARRSSDQEEQARDGQPEEEKGGDGEEGPEVEAGVELGVGHDEEHEPKDQCYGRTLPCHDLTKEGRD